VQLVSLLLAHPEEQVAEAAMDVFAEYATKKATTSAKAIPGTSRLQCIALLSCRTEVHLALLPASWSPLATYESVT
jgi:hypothetical protein